MESKRRNFLKAAGLGALGSSLYSQTAHSTKASDCAVPSAPMQWGRGVEGQRIADLGNGMFMNPIVAGDHPDPTVLKDGDDYYMTFSSFDSYPGIVIWHSKDLVNWSPLEAALHTNIGTVWALDICKHNGRFYIYIPAAKPGDPWSTFVIWADNIRGPWSEPINLNIEGCIDPGHAVGEDGKRYLFVNGIRKIRLADDGLSTEGELEHGYSPWRYPEDWIVENFAPEGPKLLRRNGWFYLVTAVGGTAGPVTGHMVIAARSRSIHGPWQDCPHNPLVRTESIDEPWWSRGHATLTEGPQGNWWMIYHAYENGYRTLGRQTLLEPIEWTDDGWFRALGGDLSQPIKKPINLSNQKSGFALSDDFNQNKIGLQWALQNPGPDDTQRIKIANKTLTFAAGGKSLLDTAPLAFAVPDRAYEVEVDLEFPQGNEAGIAVYYNRKAFVGLGFTSKFVKNYQYAEEQTWARVAIAHQSVRVKMRNDEHVLSFAYSFDGGLHWQKHPTRMEVSGMHHNVFGSFLCLKVALFSCGERSASFKNFRYRAMPV